MNLGKHLRMGVLLTTLGILMTSAVTAQPHRGNRSGDSSNWLNWMLERFDTNDDGMVTKNEFKGPSERFSMMDSNGDDKIDDADMGAMRRSRRPSNRRGTNRRSGDLLSRRHGMDKSPGVGETAPDFTLKLLNSEETVTLSQAYRDKPVILTLGSYTCPPFREAIAGIEEIYQQHNGEFAFYFVYIKEAHATDERPAPINHRRGLDFTQPTTYVEREQIAKTCQRQIELTMPILVDTLDNAVERLYAAAPNRTYLIDQDGTIMYKGVRGPRGTKPDEVLRAIYKHQPSKEESLSKKRSETDRRSNE